MSSGPSFKTIFTRDQDSQDNSRHRMACREIPLEEVKKERHHQLNLDGVEIFFPYKPYPMQVQYMHSIVRTLQGKSNGLLQSPSGSGKTMSLLCATLGWLRHQRTINFSLQEGHQKVETRIIYCTRSDTQLNQVTNPIQPTINVLSHKVIRELKLSAYKPKVCILASRDKYCIKKDFSKLKGGELKRACTQAVKEKTCGYYNYADTRQRLPDSRDKGVMDIEDLQLKGLSCEKFCPYFYSREVKDEADIVVLPTNYLLQQNSLEQFQVILKDSIIIFDDAHYVPAAAEEGMSYKIDSSILRDSLKELDNFSFVHANPLRCSQGEIHEAKQLVQAFGTLLNHFEKSNLEVQRDGCIGRLGLMSDLFEMIEQIWSDEISPRRQFSGVDDMKDSGRLQQFKEPVTASSSPASVGKEERKQQTRQSGSMQTSLLNFNFKRTLIHSSNTTRGLQPTDYDGNTHTYPACLDEPTEGPGQPGVLNMRSSISKMCMIFQRIIEDMMTMPCESITQLACFLTGISRIQQQDAAEKIKISDSYKFYFRKLDDMIEGDSNSSQSHSSAIHIWCFDPSLAFTNIQKQEPLSILLTSGSLHPMNSWEAELKIEFSVKIFISQVFDTKQSVVGAVVKAGPNRVNMNFTPSSIHNMSEVLADLAELLIDLSEKVPNGILVCFSSISSMKLVQDCWIASKDRIFTRLAQRKDVFFEPQSNIEQAKVMQEYQQKSMDDRRGAILFCECRGKISNGIEFSDKLTRAVVLVGVPYPPSTDLWVIEKMEYLDRIIEKSKEISQANISSSETVIKDKQISGKEWYFLNTVRTMNQIIGRVIRHENDFGCILLCDTRFSQVQLSSQISGWAKQVLLPYPDYPSLLQMMADLFKLRKTNEIVEEKKDIESRRPQTTLEDILIAGQVKDSFSQLKSTSQLIKEKAASTTAASVGRKSFPDNGLTSSLVAATKRHPLRSSEGKSFQNIYSSHIDFNSKPFTFELEGKEESNVHSYSSLNNSIVSINQSQAAAPGVTGRFGKRKIVIKEIVVQEAKDNLKPQKIDVLSERSNRTSRSSSIDLVNSRLELKNPREETASLNFSHTFQTSRPLLRLKSNHSDSFSSDEALSEKLPQALSSSSVFVLRGNRLSSNSNEVVSEEAGLHFEDQESKKINEGNFLKPEGEGLNSQARRPKSITILSSEERNSTADKQMNRNSAPLRSQPLKVSQNNFAKTRLLKNFRGLGSFDEGDIIKLAKPKREHTDPSDVVKVSPNFKDNVSPEKNEDQDAVTCPICYDIPKNNHKNSICEHKACYSCWEQWLSEQLTCPMCRIRCRLAYLEPCP